MSIKEHCKWLASKQIFPKDISYRDLKGLNIILEKISWKIVLAKYIFIIVLYAFSLIPCPHTQTCSHPKYTHIQNSYFIFFFVIAHVTFLVQSFLRVMP